MNLKVKKRMEVTLSLVAQYEILEILKGQNGGKRRDWAKSIVLIFFEKI